MRLICIITILTTSLALSSDQDPLEQFITHLNQDEQLNEALARITLPVWTSSAEVRKEFYLLSITEQKRLVSKCRPLSYEFYKQLHNYEKPFEKKVVMALFLFDRCQKLNIALGRAPYNTARHLVGWDEPLNWDEFNNKDAH